MDFFKNCICISKLKSQSLNSHNLFFCTYCIISVPWQANGHFFSFLSPELFCLSITDSSRNPKTGAGTLRWSWQLLEKRKHWCTQIHLVESDFIEQRLEGSLISLLSIHQVGSWMHPLLWRANRTISWAFYFLASWSPTPRLFLPFLHLLAL